MDTFYDRRRFLLASSALCASAMIVPPGISWSQETTEGPTEEIVIFGTKPSGDGTSIYDGAAILKLAKASAALLGGVAASGSAIFGAIGVGVGGLAIADPEPATKVLIALMAGVIILSALGMGGVGALYAFIAADPPRSDYKVPVCVGAVTPLPENVKGFPALNAHAALLQTGTQAARQVWDGIELWQGAQLAGDGAWMNKHYKACVDAYRVLYKSMQDLPAATQSAFEEIMKPNKLGNFEIQDLVAPHAGKTLGSIPEFRAALDMAAAQKTPCGDGIITPALELIYAQKVPANLRRAMKENVKELQKAAKGLNPPI